MIKSVEYVHDKGLSRMNEDALLIRSPTYAVFDGGTGLDDDISYLEKTGGITSGRMASHTAKRVFSQWDKPLYELALESNEKILKEMVEAGVNIDNRLALWTTNVAGVRIDEDNGFVEYIQIGDAPLIFDFLDGSRMVKYFDQDEELIQKWDSLSFTMKRDSRFKELEEEFKANRLRMNREFGYLNGEGEAENFLNTGKIRIKDGEFPIRDLKQIILCTDGILNPRAPHDWETLVKMFDRWGLKGVLKYVRTVESTDPECQIFPRYKQHDDATAIQIELESE